MDRTHPEGIEFTPEGHGFTSEVTNLITDQRMSLLYESNIVAVSRNHPDVWQAAINALPQPTRDPRTRRITGGFSDEEKRRLATLAVLVDHGLYTDDR